MEITCQKLLFDFHFDLRLRCLIFEWNWAISQANACAMHLVQYKIIRNSNSKWARGVSLNIQIENVI